MKPRATIVAVVVLAVGVGWWLRPAPDANEPSRESRLPAPAPARAEELPRWVVVGEDPMAGRVGAGLNALEGTAREDLLVLDRILSAWRSNAGGKGNPVGTNREITAVLTGNNRWNFAIISPDHPAINAAGELCDRWGTPLFFHQISGTKMELRSSGPDRERFSGDDVVITPGASRPD